MLYMRHARNGPDTGQCNGDSALTTEGELESKTVGEALRTLNIQIDTVWTSQTCRTEQTARLLEVAGVQVTSDLNPAGAPDGRDLETVRKVRLNNKPSDGRNTVLVSHVHGAKIVADRLFLAFAEVAVFRAGLAVKAEPVARIRVEDWAGLLSLAAKN